MGGFEGGDEGGYWDVDTLPSLIDEQSNKPANFHKTKCSIDRDKSGYHIKAHAKLTIFLKIIADQDGHPTLLSRLIQLDDLYNTISFVPCQCDSFTIEGYDKTNAIYKAYKALSDYTNEPEIEEFFNEHKVVVTKGIDDTFDLGGDASNLAAFMRMTKELCNLVVSSDELAKIAHSIDREAPFFIYNYHSANVTETGELVLPCDEEKIKVELYIPKIRCDQNLLYQTFQEKLLPNISLSSFEGWDELDSKSLLKRFSTPKMANDLYAATLIAYPALKKEAKEGRFFSGSIFFKLLSS